MKSIDDILRILRQEKAYLHERYHVASIAIFGSVARGDSKETSDIDIYVELDQPLGWEFVDLADELETVLEAKVDLADQEMLKRLWPYVKQDMVYA